MAEQINTSIPAIVSRMKTQPNYCSRDVIFDVMATVRVSGIDFTEAHDGYFWFDHEAGSEVTDANRVAALERAHERGDSLGSVQRVQYVEMQQSVESFFTEAAATAYIAKHGHEMRNPRITAESAVRNPELAAVRNYLLSLDDNGETQACSSFRAALALIATGAIDQATTISVARGLISMFPIPKEPDPCK
jgi:hypothetical protein